MAIATINPATSERIRSFEPLGEAQIDGKLQRASDTFAEYRRMPFAERARWMTRAAEREPMPFQCGEACKGGGIGKKRRCSLIEPGVG